MEPQSVFSSCRPRMASGCTNPQSIGPFRMEAYKPCWMTQRIALPTIAEVYKPTPHLTFARHTLSDLLLRPMCGHRPRCASTSHVLASVSLPSVYGFLRVDSQQIMNLTLGACFGIERPGIWVTSYYFNPIPLLTSILLSIGHA